METCCFSDEFFSPSESLDRKTPISFVTTSLNKKSNPEIMPAAQCDQSSALKTKLFSETGKALFKLPM
jgi:hypothetical protein